MIYNFIKYTISLILFGIFGGYTTLVETASLVTIYVFIVEVFIYKDLKWKNIKRIILDCSTLIGGVLIIKNPK